MTDAELKTLLKTAEEKTYNTGDVVVAAGNPALPCDRVFLIKSGGAVLVASDLVLPGQVDLQLGNVVETGRLIPGGLFNEEAAAAGVRMSGGGGGGGGKGVQHPLKASMVAAQPNTVVISFTSDQLALATNGSRSRRNSAGGFKSLSFKELEFHRIVGTGQFGLVRLVRHVSPSQPNAPGDVYALKVRVQVQVPP